jgi:hypothetical protein
MVKVNTNKDNKVFAYYRDKGRNRVIVFLNLTRKSVSFKPDLKDLDGEYKEYFTGEKTTLPLSVNLTLNPWGYKVFIK